MNHLAFDPAFVQRVAGALLHFVWQGAAIATIAAICLSVMSRRSAETRYLVSIFGLAGMLAAPVLTFVLYDRIGDVTLKALAWVSDGDTTSAVAASPMLMYWIVGLWSAGVFGCIGRLILAWHFSCRLLRAATHQVPVEIAAIFERTAAVLGIDVVRKRIRLLVSGAVDSPAVVGWIRPAILVPVSALTGLTEEQLMAVLAHELAHIRRHDFLVNTLQTCVESLLFYHPAVWWMSGRVRAERENCCDDLAVRVCGNRRLYVQALVDLERTRPRLETLAVSAAGGSLKERVRRLLGFQTSTVDWRSVLVTFAFVCVWMVAGLWHSALSGAVPPAPQFRQQQPAQLAAALPTLTPAAAATVVSTVAAIATAQPVVPEPQNSEQKVGVTGGVTGRVVDMATGKGHRVQFLVLCCDYSRATGSRRGAPPPQLGTPFLPTISDDGSFVFPSVPPGNYYLSVGGFWRDFNVYPDSDLVPVSWALAVGANGVTGLQLDVTEGVEVQGTVLDQTGRPVAASVQLRPKPANSVFNTIGPPIYTGGSGRVSEPPQYTGPLSIRGGQFGLLIPRANPSLDGIQERILEKARTLVRSGTAGADGRFAFQKVYPGTYVLEVKSGNLAVPGPEIQVGIAGLTNVSFQVPAIRVTGRVIAPGGDRLPQLNYIRMVRSGSDTDIFYGFPDSEGHFSLVLAPGQYRLFTERLGTPVQSVSDGSRDITNTEFTVEGGRNPQILVTLAP